MLLVTCAIIIQNNRILCAKRGAGMSLPGKWEFPGGKVEPGETNEECLIREINEELGVTITIKNQLPTFPYTYPTGVSLTLIPMICELVSGTPRPVEHESIRWVEKNKLKELDWAEADVAIVNALQQMSISDF